MFGVAAVLTVAGLIRQPRRSTALLAGFLATGFATSVLRGLVSEGSTAEGNHLLTAISLAGEIVTAILIYEFTREFEHRVRWMDRMFRGAAIALVITPFLMPALAPPGQTGPWYTIVYDICAVLFTVSIFGVVCARFWRDARLSVPGVMQSRMQMITWGSIVFIGGVLATALVPNDSGIAIGRTAIGVAVLMLAAGCVPPQGLRAWWRRKTLEPLGHVAEQLISIDTREQIYDSMLPRIAGLVGAHRIEVLTPDGAVVATHTSRLPRQGDHPILDFPITDGLVRVHASRYAPVYGDDELLVIGIVISHMMLAIDRCDRFQAELEVAQQLRAADKIKTTFLAAVSHDLRNPLGVIVGYGHLLQQNGGTPATSNVDPRMCADQILSSAARLEGMLDSLLDLSRITVGRVELDIEESNLFDIAKRVANNIADPVSIVRVRGLPLVWDVDAGKVERILENLVVNAEKHTPPGSIIEMTIGHDDGEAVIKVEDDGPGIPEDQWEQLFEPFHQGSDTHIPGSGLGLTIASRLAELHGGSVTIGRSHLGGASFEVRLPHIAHARSAEFHGERHGYMSSVDT